MGKIVFKPTNQNQPALFPFSFDAIIPANHPVRLVNRICETSRKTTNRIACKTTGI